KSIYPGFTNQCHQSSGMAIQFVYDVKKNMMNYINIHSALANDSLSSKRLDWLTSNSLLIRDLGYFSMESIKSIKDKNAPQSLGCAE
ncbi:MAG TPA: hypothetical protein VNW99_09525, partial [Cytophagaceae bacterium]|nr:hypothetical protein [Cytophagaceae bacterium]